MRTRPILLCCALAVTPALAVAQASDALYSRATALTGVEYRGFSFEGATFPNTMQFRIPVIAVVPIGRQVSLDVATNFASSRTEGAGGDLTLSGLTDTQIRALYTVSRDRVVASVGLNLPTGQQKLTSEEFAVAGAVSSTFLSFPVASVGMGFSATGGLAWAQPVGAWSLGLSGSFRYQGSYTPTSDTTLGLKEYSPGTEIRVRAGLDRLLGQSTRITLGGTFSTFSTDEFVGAGQVPSGRYQPGPRIIGEFALVRVVGRSTVTFVMWDYFRTAGKTNDVTDDQTQENVFNAELRWGFPVSPRVQLEPLVGFRQYGLKDFSGGSLVSGGLTARLGLSDRMAAHLAGRFDGGWVAARDVGRATLTGVGLTAFLRYSR